MRACPPPTTHHPHAHIHTSPLPPPAAKLAAELPIAAGFPLLFGSILYPCCGLAPALPRLARFLGVLTLEAAAASAIGLTLGAAAPTPDAAMAVGPPSMVVFIVFGGLYTASSAVPRWLRWVPKASLIARAFEALAVNEFAGAAFDAPLPGDAATGEQALRRVELAGGSVAAGARGLACIAAANYGATYLLLLRGKSRYARMLPPV